MEVDKNSEETTGSGDASLEKDCIKPAVSKKGDVKDTSKKIRTLVPSLQNAGHTGYLTFATRPRLVQDSQAIANDQEKIDTSDSTTVTQWIQRLT